MDLSALRALVRDVNFETHGVPATVTVPDGEPVETRIIWLTPLDAEVPAGVFQRQEPRRAMAIRRDDIPAVPRGSLIEVTEHLLTEIPIWVVDGMEATRYDHHRVVVRAYEPST